VALGLKRLGIVGTFVLVFVGCHGIHSESLDTVVATVSRLHQVAGVDVSDLTDSVKVSNKPVLLFDVREPDEFNTSHLNGAIRVDPDVKAETFLKEHGEVLKGKAAVFYCSVGYRSSILGACRCDGGFHRADQLERRDLQMV